MPQSISFAGPGTLYENLQVLYVDLQVLYDYEILSTCCGQIRLQYLLQLKSKDCCVYIAAKHI